MSGTEVPVAFVKQETRDQWEADHNSVQQADFRDYCANIISDAMKKTAGL